MDLQRIDPPPEHHAPVVLDHAAVGALVVPNVVAAAGERTVRRFLEFFAATIRNVNTRAAYLHATLRFFSWCELRGLTLERIEPLAVAAYIEHHPGSAPTVKQHLAAIRQLFGWLVSGGTLATNPAASVKGPRYVVRKGKSAVLSAAEVKQLFASIDASTLTGARDLALIGVMVHSFARIGAVVAMRRDDYYPQGKRWWLRLREKGGRLHEVPAHHTAEAMLDAYLEKAGITDPKAPLFQSIEARGARVSGLALDRRNALVMVKRRAAAAGLTERLCNHSFRATGITTYLLCGGTLEKAQAIAAHESPITTKLYDRTVDQISLGEIERITF